MKEKRNSVGIEGRANDKRLAKKIVNLLCRYAQNGEHQHIPQCFDTLTSIEEKEAFKQLTSLENMALTDSLYIARAVVPLVESLPSHNGAEPSHLYSLLRDIVRESTDALEKEVEEQQLALAEKEQVIQDLAEKNGISGLTAVSEIDAAIQKIKSIESGLIKKPKDMINDIQAQKSRIAKLPQLNEATKKVSSEQALELKRSYVSRLNNDLKGSEEKMLRVSERNKQADGSLDKQKAKNKKAHEVYETLSQLIDTIPESYGLQSPAAKKHKARRFGFFKDQSQVLVSKSNNKKDFALKAKRGLCDNIISLLDQYIHSPGHSKDRMDSAKKIYSEACKLRVDDKLSLLEKDRRLLDLIRAENIASKGRWNGRTSKLFAIYRAAEFYYKEQLQIESGKVLSVELAAKNEMAEKMSELNELLQGLETQKSLMVDSNVKLNQLREDELLLVMNAEEGTLTDEKQTANSRIQNNQSRKLEKLSANEQKLVQTQSDLLQKEIEAVVLSLDSDRVIADIKALYNKARNISIRLLSQGKVSLAILPESDTLPSVSEMVSRATAYLTALKASAEEEKTLVTNADHQNVSSSVVAASF